MDYHNNKRSHISSVDEIDFLRLELWREKSLEELKELYNKKLSEKLSLDMFDVKNNTVDSTNLSQSQKYNIKVMGNITEELKFYIEYREQREQNDNT